MTATDDDVDADSDAMDVIVEEHRCRFSAIAALAFAFLAFLADLDLAPRSPQIKMLQGNRETHMTMGQNLFIILLFTIFSGGLFTSINLL